MPAWDVLCLGYACYDLAMQLDGFPEEDRKYSTASSWESGGGPAANAAWLLAHWGAACAFGGVVGDDLYGRRVLQELAAAGADTGLVEVRPGLATPLSVLLVNRLTGTRTVVNRRDPRPPLRLPAGAREPGPRLLLFDGHEPEAALEALRRWPAARSILDAGSRRPGVEALAGRVDHLVGSRDYALAMTGVVDLEGEGNRRLCLRRLRALGAREVAVTLGAQGLIYARGEGCEALPARRVKAVDTTAAGDIFHGAFAFGLLEGQGYEASLAFAAAAAALSTTRVGGRFSAPTLEETRAAAAGRGMSAEHGVFGD